MTPACIINRKDLKSSLGSCLKYSILQRTALARSVAHSIKEGRSHWNILKLLRSSHLPPASAYNSFIVASPTPLPSISNTFQWLTLTLLRGEEGYHGNIIPSLSLVLQGVHEIRRR